MRSALILLLLLPRFVSAAVLFVPTTPGSIETQDFAEVEVRSIAAPGNPFTQFALRGMLTTPEGKSFPVDGFCDAANGTLHRIRFLATTAGRYTYALSFDNQADSGRYEGSFTATKSQRKGLLQVDPEHPFHFQWQGTGEHFYWNGLTTYALLGWKDVTYIGQIIGRAATYKVNHLRVTLIGPRVADASRWYEPLQPDVTTDM